MPGLSAALPPASGLTMSGLSSALPPSLVPHALTNSQRYTRGWQQQILEVPAQSLVQSAPVMQPSVLQSSLSRLQQNQQSAIAHSTQSMLQQTAMPQQNILAPQHQQHQLIDSTTQTGRTNEADWQEEVYLKIKVLKEMYLPELSEMYQKIATKLQQHESLPQQPTSDLLERLKVFKTMLERLMTTLQVSKVIFHLV
ncbi:hypothetical protein M0R45_036817 [Rubus argutus]|uniref:Mediator of RNA polymerase II transcription subunit 15a-like n=1 Tax=Rubus argutus TaxID=59490 RepID=A0AAW1VZY2_RUBAR